MRSTKVDASIDPEKEWRGYQNWNFVRTVAGRITSISRSEKSCSGTLSTDWCSKDGRKLHCGPRAASVEDLCELARVETSNGGPKGKAGQNGRLRLRDLEESGNLDEALRGAPARSGAPSSPYPRALGPLTPGQAVYSTQDGHGASRGQIGFVLGVSKNGELVDVGFYCRRVSVMETLGGLGVGAIVGSQAHRLCRRDVPLSQLSPTSDQPPLRGAP
jgi:hypothetical protein